MYLHISDAHTAVSIEGYGQVSSPQHSIAAQKQIRFILGAVKCLAQFKTIGIKRPGVRWAEFVSNSNLEICWRSSKI